MPTKSVTFKSRNADVRVLNKKDLVSLGLDDSVDFKQTSFTRGEAVEVDSAIADILLSSDVLEGEFEENLPADKQASVSKQK